MNFRKTIAGKLIACVLIIFGFILINAIYTYSTMDKSKKIDLKIREVANPLLYGTNEFTMLATKSKMLSINWVYLQSNETDKKNLKQLHQESYPLLKTNLTVLLREWNDTSLVNQLQKSFILFEEILKTENEIMTTLVAFDDYEDPMKKLMAEDLIHSKIVPLSEQLIVQLSETEKKINKDIISIKDELQSSFNNTKQILILFSIITILIGIIIIFFAFKQIIVPIKRASSVLNTIALGIIPENVNTKISNDEIGEMIKATNVLIKNSKATSDFANEIGKGNYEKEFKPLSEKDAMGIALIEMRDKLRISKTEDEKRHWSTVGLAEFAELLRKADDPKVMGDKIISKLVKYTKSNQGTLFIINDEKENDIHIEQLACYAWDRKKFVQKRIEIGEGLAGQAVQEKEYIYLTDVPDNYVEITSGLGEANPRSVLIMPLKVNDEILGVIELASFRTFESFEIDFVQKIGESIAATIKAMKVNIRTNKLLQESQLMTEQLKAQEEEMRQNMEEMSSTQEEMQRKEQDFLNKIEGLEVLAKSKVTTEE